MSLEVCPGFGNYDGLLSISGDRDAMSGYNLVISRLQNILN